MFLTKLPIIVIGIKNNKLYADDGTQILVTFFWLR